MRVAKGKRYHYTLYCLSVDSEAIVQVKEFILIIPQYIVL